MNSNIIEEIFKIEDLLKSSDEMSESTKQYVQNRIYELKIQYPDDIIDIENEFAKMCKRCGIDYAELSTTEPLKHNNQ